MVIAAKRLVWGKMANLGQTCVAPDYILCTEKVRDQFVQVVKDVLKEFYGGKSGWYFSSSPESLNHHRPLSVTLGLNKRR